MKKILALLWLLLFIGVLAHAEGFSFNYEYNSYFVYPSGTNVCIYATLKEGANGTPITAALTDSDGTVLCEKQYSSRNETHGFTFVMPDDWTGMHELAVYVDGEQCSEIFPVFVKEQLKPVKRVETDEHKIAITIDCGSGGTYGALEWLEVLEKYDARATFFLTGRWASEHPEAVEAIVAAGHEVGNHSYNHYHMETVSAWKTIKYELLGANAVIEELSVAFVHT